MSRRKPEPPKPLSEDDLWLNELRNQCANAIAKHLLAAVNVQRPINSLSIGELEGVAEACVSCWIVATSKRIAEQPETVAPEYSELLFG